MIHTVTKEEIYEAIKEYDININLDFLDKLFKGDNYGRFSSQGTGVYKYTQGDEVSDGRTN